MTQEEIQEYNRICADFLKFKYKNQAKFWAKYPLDDNSYLSQFGFMKIHSFKFHSSWDWIMEVVEKIENLYEHPNKEISINIKPGEIEIFQRPYRLENNNYHDVIYLGDGYINTSKKEAVVQAINQFLIWYENNKNNKNIQ